MAEIFSSFMHIERERERDGQRVLRLLLCTAGGRCRAKVKWISQSLTKDYCRKRRRERERERVCVCVCLMSRLGLVNIVMYQKHIMINCLNRKEKGSKAEQWPSLLFFSLLFSSFLLSFSSSSLHLTAWNWVLYDWIHIKHAMQVG